MLIVISDLHFVDETAGKHNLPFGAFEDVFLSDIASLAENKGVKKIKVLLLGDIVDLLRSEQWFDVDPADRPWGANGLKDIPNPQKESRTEQQCLKILGQVQDNELSNPKSPASLSDNTILYKNWDTFKLFREFQSRLRQKFKVDAEVELIYIPGNHDRLCNLYPSVRDGLRKILDLTVNASVEGDPKGDWKYCYDFKDEDYGVYARHGHQFDEMNYADSHKDNDERSLETPIGDAMTTEFAVKISFKLNSLRGEYPDIRKEDFDDLVERTKDIDNVRPLSKVVDWIVYRIQKEKNTLVKEALNKAFRQTAKEFLDIDFVRNSKAYNNIKLRIASSRWLNWLTDLFIDSFGAEKLLPWIMGMSDEPADPGKGPLAIAAYKESIWRNNDKIQFILYGHTHAPLQLPLDNKDGKEVIYLNTGTWRNKIMKTIELDQPPDFIELKTMTYAIFYKRDDEDMGWKLSGTVSFDVWTGARKKVYEKKSE